jgi:LuxR family quorum sensing-dependent transcriptional regulator
MLEQEAFTFIENLDRLSTTDEVMDAFEQALRPLGFETLIVNGLPPPMQRGEELVLAARWPAELVTLYAREHYARYSPLSRRCKESDQPFEWNGAFYYHDADPRAAEVMRRAADFGLERGFIVPIHGPRGYLACVGMTGAYFDLRAPTKAAIHLMAHYSFLRLRSLLVMRPAAKPSLTSREREVLMWVAAGKSAWEIGEILKISKRTVNEHSQTATRKLGAVNRAPRVSGSPCQLSRRAGAMPVRHR